MTNPGLQTSKRPRPAFFSRSGHCHTHGNASSPGTPCPTSWVWGFGKLSNQNPRGPNGTNTPYLHDPLGFSLRHDPRQPFRCDDCCEGHRADLRTLKVHGRGNPRGTSWKSSSCSERWRICDSSTWFYSWLPLPWPPVWLCPGFSRGIRSRS